MVFLWPSGDDSEDASAGTGAAAAAERQRRRPPRCRSAARTFPRCPTPADSCLPPGEDEAVGLPAPTLTGQSFDESEVVIDPGDGNAEDGCLPRPLVPSLPGRGSAASRTGSTPGHVPEGFEIVSVSTGVDSTRPNYSPSNWLSSEGWTPPVLLDDDAQTAAISYGLTGFPYFVMLDAEGNVWQRGSGEIPIERAPAHGDEVTSGAASTGGDGEQRGSPDRRSS